MFNNKFIDRIMDLVGYVDYIIDPYRESPYVVDITMIADPYFKSHSNFKTNGYGEPVNKENNNITDINNNEKLNTNTYKCTLNWHQDHFVETKTQKEYAYDFVALFVLKAHDTSEHKLMIGKIKDDIDIKDMDIDTLQKHIITISETDISNEINSDVGYIIDQRQKFFHKHSDFECYNKDSRRNVIAIRIKRLHTS